MASSQALQVVDKGAQFRRYVAAVRIVEIEAGKARAIILEDGHELAPLHPETKAFLHAEGDAYRALALQPEAIGRAVRFAIERPDDVDVNEIVIRPTASR